MHSTDLIRYWKDPKFRQHFSSEQRATLPENPAGVSFLTDSELRSIVGALPPRCTCSPSAITSVTTHPTCPDCG